MSLSHHLYINMKSVNNIWLLKALLLSLKNKCLRRGEEKKWNIITLHIEEEEVEDISVSMSCNLSQRSCERNICREKRGREREISLYHSLKRMYERRNLNGEMKARSAIRERNERKKWREKYINAQSHICHL